jgi:hypothetical protein
MIPVSGCRYCVHLTGTGRTCTAYTTRIPDRFWLGESLHLSVQKRQIGKDTLVIGKDSDVDALRLAGLTTRVRVPVAS